MAEDEMVRWHHQLNGHEFEQTPGDSGGQRSLMCSILGVAKSLTVTEQLLNPLCLIPTCYIGDWKNGPKAISLVFHCPRNQPISNE